MKRDDLFAGYEQGQADMLAKCIAAVEAEPYAPDGLVIHASEMKGRIWLALRDLLDGAE